MNTVTGRLRAAIASLIARIAVEADSAFQSIREKCAALEAENAELKQGVEDVITEISPDESPADVVNPTPVGDAIVKAANEAPGENSADVDAAMEKVDTEEAVTEDEVNAAAQQLTDAMATEAVAEADEEE